MDIKNWTRKTSRGFYSITEVAAWIGYIVVAGIVLIVFVDVCGRYFLNKPLPGAFELVEQSMVVLGGFAIMYAAVKRVHVSIDIIAGRFSTRTRAIMHSIFSLLGFGTSVVLAHQVYLYAVGQLTQTTAVLRIVTVPFTSLLAVALFLCGLMLLVQAFYPWVSEEIKGKKEDVFEQ